MKLPEDCAFLNCIVVKNNNVSLLQIYTIVICNCKLQNCKV